MFLPVYTHCESSWQNSALQLKIIIRLEIFQMHLSHASRIPSKVHNTPMPIYLKDFNSHSITKQLRKITEYTQEFKAT
jgi:hypothetical protein